jgi:predicted HicB family RNase H-like nuclease
MTAKSKRFGYLPQKPELEAKAETRQASAQDVLTTVARGQGRMDQEREQLNVRVPVRLKRLTASKAALEGKTLGELVETLLLEYIKDIA